MRVTSMCDDRHESYGMSTNALISTFGIEQHFAKQASAADSSVLVLMGDAVDTGCVVAAMLDEHLEGTNLKTMAPRF